MVHPPKRFTRKITKVAVEFRPDAMMVGKKYTHNPIMPTKIKRPISIPESVMFLIYSDNNRVNN